MLFKPALRVAPAPFSELPAHHFGTGLVDPPYHFETYSAKGQGTRAPSAHYSDMVFDEIKTLPVGELFADDAWFWLWCPGTHLHHALELIEAWGFKFSGSGFVWAKRTSTDTKWAFGMGKTTRKSCEFCLLGRRGKPKILSHRVRELIVSVPREHSRKPDEQYARIEAFGSGPYVELFARQRRPGWMSWGDQINQFTPDDYDSATDIDRSVAEGFRAIRERVAKGGPGWGE